MKDMELMAENLYKDEVMSIDILIEKKKKSKSRPEQLCGSVFQNDFVREVVCCPTYFLSYV